MAIDPLAGKGVKGAARHGETRVDRHRLDGDVALAAGEMS